MIFTLLEQVGLEHGVNACQKQKCRFCTLVLFLYLKFFFFTPAPHQESATD